MRVAALQLSSGIDVSDNLEACRELVARAASRGARLIVLPEGFAFLGPERDKRRIAERLGDPDAPIQKALSSWAEETRSTLIAGGFAESSDDPERPYNACLVVGPSGERIGVYRKIHLFDVELPDGTAIRESEATQPGSEPVVVGIDIGGGAREAEVRVGLSVCYDLRFPELYRALVDRGANVLVVPSAFTMQTGKDHWRVLLRARAIESQCWVLAAGQWGPRPKGPPSFGNSMIIDPWGTVIAQASEGVGMVMADLDASYLERVRRTLPSLRHRRL